MSDPALTFPALTFLAIGLAATTLGLLVLNAAQRELIKVLQEHVAQLQAELWPDAEASDEAAP